MSIHEYSPEGKTYALGIDLLRENDQSVVEMIDKMAAEEIQLVARLERVVHTKLYFIEEHTKLISRIAEQEPKV